MIALMRLITGELRLPKDYLGKTVRTDNEDDFTIFRQITRHTAGFPENTCSFIVSFRFARGSHMVNKFASILPMLVIAGYPGFITKVYAVNRKNGHWQGMYQWESPEKLERYRQSPVFRIMNQRASKDPVTSKVIEGRNMEQYIKDIMH
jgi:hypothetical protein